VFALLNRHSDFLALNEKARQSASRNATHASAQASTEALESSPNRLISFERRPISGPEKSNATQANAVDVVDVTVTEVDVTVVDVTVPVVTVVVVEVLVVAVVLHKSSL
jgi:hypothetical protein